MAGSAGAQEPLLQSSVCMLLGWDIYSTGLSDSVSTWIYVACGCRTCGDYGDTHQFKGLVLGLGTQAPVEVTKSKQWAGRGNVRPQLHRAGQLVQRVVRPGETRGFPTWCPSCGDCGRGEAGVGGQRPVSVSSPPWQSGLSLQLLRRVKGQIDDKDFSL